MGGSGDQLGVLMILETNTFMPRRRQRPDGFTLVELVLVIVIIGILVSVGIKKIGPMNQAGKIEETKAEMNTLAMAICGNPELENNGIRTDFGYIGDVGSMPPDLNALLSNPGGYSTWSGPYISNSFEQIAGDYNKDAWQTDYLYSGGNIITSTGSGANIIRNLSGSVDYLLYNKVSGNVYDLDGTPPGTDYNDSILIRLTIPDGSGSRIIKTSNPDQGGYFSFDSIPIGNHEMEIIYEPDNDTLERFVSVLPGSSTNGLFHLPANVWYDPRDNLDNGLIACWRLDEDSGLIAYNGCSSGSDAELQNDAVGAGWTTGKISGAFEFDGVDDFFRTPTNSTELQLTDMYSISVWIFPDSIQNDWAGICSKATPSGDDNHWTLQFDNSSVLSKRITIYHPNGYNWRSTYTLNDCRNAWHHIVVTYRLTPARIQLYVDGVFHSESTSLTQGPGNGNGKLHIGAERIEIPFKGKIDDLRIYNRVLDSGEIQALYNLNGV